VSSPALVLLPAVIGIAWLLPPIYTTILIGIIVVLAFDEYARMARLGSEGFPRGHRRRGDAGRLRRRLGRRAAAPGLRAGAAGGGGRRGRTRPARRGRRAPRRGDAVPAAVSRRPARPARRHSTRSRTDVAAGAVPGGRRQRFGAVLRRAHDGPAAAGAAHQPKKTVEGAITGVVVAAAGHAVLGRVTIPDAPSA
jgi:hypothetical protein